jgi:hypothetical protein
MHKTTEFLKTVMLTAASLTLASVLFTAAAAGLGAIHYAVHGEDPLTMMECVEAGTLAEDLLNCNPDMVAVRQGHDGAEDSEVLEECISASDSALEMMNDCTMDYIWV